MTEFETKCYGMSEADIRQDYMKSLTASHCGLEFVVMGLLSDAQELQGFGNAQAYAAGGACDECGFACEHGFLRKNWGHNG